jgi:hypothetical protein
MGLSRRGMCSTLGSHQIVALYRRLAAGLQLRAGSRMIESGGESQARASQIEGADLMEDAVHEAVFDRFA